METEPTETVNTPAETESLVSAPIQNVTMPYISEGIELTPNGLVVGAAEITAASFNDLFRAVTTLSRASNWLLGDTLDLAERVWGNQATGSKYEEAAKATGLAIPTLRAIVSVCHRIPIAERHPNLSFSHHLEACNRTESASEREMLLTRAEEEKLPLKQFRKELLSHRAAEIAKTGETSAPRDLEGELVSPERVEAMTFPKSYEFCIIAEWAERTDMDKVKAEERGRLIRKMLPTFRKMYELLQLEQEANPDTAFDLPFEVKPLD